MSIFTKNYNLKENKNFKFSYVYRFLFLIFSLFLFQFFFPKIIKNISSFRQISLKKTLSSLEFQNYTQILNFLYSYSLERGKYKVLTDNIYLMNKSYYLIKNANIYRAYSLKEDKLLFSLITEKNLFLLENNLFSISDTQKFISHYNDLGVEKYSLSFLNSITAIAFNGEFLVLGFINGDLKVYKQGKLFYEKNFNYNEKLSPIYSLTLNDKYLVFFYGNSFANLEVLDLSNNFYSLYILRDITFPKMDLFLKIDKDYIFLELKEYLLQIDLKRREAAKVLLKDYIILDAFKREDFQDSLLFFYSPLRGILNLKTYKNFSLKEDILINDNIIDYTFVNKSILYLNNNNEFKFLG